MLQELEPVDNVALVCCEEEATALDGLAGFCFCGGNFGSELDTATDNAVVGDVCVDGWTFKIGSRVGLPGVSGEGASVLCRLVVSYGVLEIVIA